MTSSRDSRRTLVKLALTWTFVAGAAAATAGGDPLHAPDCREAIDALQAREADADALAHDTTGTQGGHGPSDALLAARRDAARRCLASRADPPAPPGRPIEPPIVVAPIAVPVPAGSVARRTPPIAPTRAPITGPRTVTSCDAAGCWTSDGTRVDRFGPNLWGRRGVCTVSGGVLQCP